MNMDNPYRNIGNPDSGFEGQGPRQNGAGADDPKDETTPSDKDDDVDVEDEDDDDFEDGDDEDSDDEAETGETGDTEPE